VKDFIVLVRLTASLLVMLGTINGFFDFVDVHGSCHIDFDELHPHLVTLSSLPLATKDAERALEVEEIVFT